MTTAASALSYTWGKGVPLEGQEPPHCMSSAAAALIIDTRGVQERNYRRLRSEVTSGYFWQSNSKIRSFCSDET